ncbi:deoxyribose-phosphate aldolase [Corynebacterium massiliense]|uniref:Deoxyribose-phosphate aldolase n=1 Tax=Corynebacterium massiliense DSM 45435 TaxID=1121364 RepID=A0ABY7U5W3_9CORY|nr:deoxyribose-phosphate aldolase [Corynebacterium massiliense]WCZ31638.1 Deoxyribose-phosphate aldolase [Corynebacterium massiliense DSM 45435]
MSQLLRDELAQMIDHTFLKPEGTREQVEQLAREAGEWGTYSICVSPSQLSVDVPEGVHVATVVGFPSGAVKSEVKAVEAARAVDDGAQEIDMVMNLGLALEGRFDEVQEDIQAVRDAVPHVVLKVILETAVLDRDLIVAACKAAEAAGADFVKTSTGFHPAGGATTDAVSLMRETVGDRLGVKASGGIRTAAAAQEMVDAGASRLGLSATVSILSELDES